nr:uncharacterized protein LOC125638616 isoform X2 [Caretta caretta]
MEQGTACDPHQSPPPCAPQGTPLTMTAERAELLVSTLANTARLVHRAGEAYKSAQLACFHAGQVLAQAGEVLSLSKQSYLQARCLGDGLLGSLPQSDYQGLFRCLARPPLAYEEFKATLRRAESIQAAPMTAPCAGPRSPGPRDAPMSGRWTRTARRRRRGGHCRSEDVTPPATDRWRPCGWRTRWGGAFVTQRRRSPRRSPSGGLEGLSPLVSEQELSTIQPLIHCPSRQGGPGKFLSKVTRRDRPPCEKSDSNTDQSETVAKATA